MYIYIYIYIHYDPRECTRCPTGPPASPFNKVVLEHYKVGKRGNGKGGTVKC